VQSKSKKLKTQTHASIFAISVKESSKKPSGSARYLRKDYIKADNTVDV